MFSLKKLVLAAACVALALGPSAVNAESQGMHLRIRISDDSVKASHALAKATPSAKESSEDGDNDAYEGSGEGSTDDDEEGKGDYGEDDGSHGEVDSYADKDAGSEDDDKPTPPPGTHGGVSGDEPPATPAPFCKGDGEYTMSIEYVEGIFCVKGAACTADNADGVCPGPQKGLPLGAKCGKVSSGVYGCKAITVAPPTLAPYAGPPADESSGSSDEDEGEDKDADGPADFCPGEGEYEISVEGADGMYCIKGQACVSDIADGVCPGVQKGLPYGSSCAKVNSSVYGCKVNKAPAKKKEEDSKKKKTHVSTKKVQQHQSKKKPTVHKSKKVEHAKKPTVQHKKTVEHAKKPAAAVHQKKTKAAVHQKNKAEASHGKKTKTAEKHHGKKN
ncbi:hypothetical protein Gpo141_00009971 [Globisporangium polare]